MIKQDQITLTLPLKTIKSLDLLAAEKRVSREQIILEMFQYYEQRNRLRVRSEIKRVATRKRKDPIVGVRVKKYLSEPKRVSEKQLGKDIEAAIAAVRSSRRIGD